MKILTQRTFDLLEDLTPEVMAEELACGFTYDQTRFFNALAAEMESWPKRYEFQLQAIIDEKYPPLSDAALRLLRKLGEYSA